MCGCHGCEEHQSINGDGRISNALESIWELYRTSAEDVAHTTWARVSMMRRTCKDSTRAYPAVCLFLLTTSSPTHSPRSREVLRESGSCLHP